MAYTDIDKPTDYFNTNLWTGDDSNPRSITSTHATDFVWIKSRNQSYIHRLFDSVRGATKRLRSNGTDAEDTASTEVTAFTSTGYTIDSGLNSTAPTTNWVGWSWKAGGSASSNTDGSITSSVSANTTAGFSIVSWTGNGSNGATIGHGLGVTPAIVITKRRSAVGDWLVGGSLIDTVRGGANSLLLLNGTNAMDSNSEVYQTFSSTTFQVGTNEYANTSGSTMISYCFAEKKGFSKFGSYTGNGNADGTFVYTGFRPAFTIIKRTDTANSWMVGDNKINPFNVTDNMLRADLSDAQQSGNYVDYLSNGFKPRLLGNAFNASGGTYIYMAFAENPLVTSTGIPTVAR